MSEVPFDDIVVGATLPSRRYTVDADAVSSYRSALALPPADYVPSMFCVVLMKEMRRLLPAPPGGIHAEQHFEFEEPLRIGDTIEVTSTIKDKYVRNERRNVVIATAFTRSDGVVVARGEARRIWAR